MLQECSTKINELYEDVDLNQKLVWSQVESEASNRSSSPSDVNIPEAEPEDEESKSDLISGFDSSQGKLPPLKLNQNKSTSPNMAKITSFNEILDQGTTESKPIFVMQKE